VIVKQTARIAERMQRYVITIAVMDCGSTECHLIQYTMQYRSLCVSSICCKENTHRKSSLTGHFGPNIQVQSVWLKWDDV